MRRRADRVPDAAFLAPTLCEGSQTGLCLLQMEFEAKRILHKEWEKKTRQNLFGPLLDICLCLFEINIDL